MKWAVKIMFNGVLQAAGAGSFPSWSAQGSLDGAAVCFNSSLRRLALECPLIPVKGRNALLGILPLAMPL